LSIFVSVELFLKLNASLHISIALIELPLMNILAPPPAIDYFCFTRLPGGRRYVLVEFAVEDKKQ
jgi:hypothetical protein